MKEEKLSELAEDYARNYPGLDAMEQELKELLEIEEGIHCPWR